MVIGTGHLEPERCARETRPIPAAGLAIDPAEDDEHAGLLGTADQRLDPVEHEAVGLHVDVGAVTGDVGAGVRLGHADCKDTIAADDLRQDAFLDRGRSISGDDAGLDPSLTERRHRGNVTAFGNLLQNERGIEDRQAEPTILLRHRHTEHPSSASFFMFGHGKVPSIYFSVFGLNSASTRFRTLAIISLCWPEILKSIVLFFLPDARLCRQHRTRFLPGEDALIVPTCPSPSRMAEPPPLLRQPR